MTDHQLIEELKAARLRLADARKRMEDAHVAYLERKAECRREESAIEEILNEIETGKTGRPVLDACDGSDVSRAPDPNPQLADGHFDPSHLPGSGLLPAEQAAKPRKSRTKKTTT